MPAGGAQGIAQGLPHMPSIPFADPAAASSSSSAQQSGRPFQSAEMMSSEPISMDSVFTSSQVLESVVLYRVSAVLADPYCKMQLPDCLSRYMSDQARPSAFYPETMPAEASFCHQEHSMTHVCCPPNGGVP